MLGSIIYALTQWGILIVIAKFGNPELVGIFTLALAITAPLVLFFRFNLRSIVASDSKNEFNFDTYYSLRVASTVLFTITSIVIALFYSHDWEVTLVIIVLGLSKSVESISDILHGQMQKHERLDITAKSRILKGILSLVIFTIVMYLTSNLVLSTFSYFITWLLILIIYDYPQTYKFGKFYLCWEKNYLIKLFVLSIPLGVAQLIASLNANIPRYLIEYFHNPELLGFFGAIMYIITSGNRFIMAIGAAIIPRLSKYYSFQKIKEFIKLLGGFMALIFGSGLIAMIIIKLFGTEILTLLYTSEYSNYSNEFFCFSVLGLIIYMNKALEIGLTATRVFKIQPYINIVTLSIIIVSGFYYIPMLGIVGALYSLMLGEITQLILRIAIMLFVLSWGVKNKY